MKLGRRAAVFSGDGAPEKDEARRRNGSRKIRVSGHAGKFMLAQSLAPMERRLKFADRGRSLTSAGAAGLRGEQVGGHPMATTSLLPGTERLGTGTERERKRLVRLGYSRFILLVRSSGSGGIGSMDHKVNFLRLRSAPQSLDS